LTLTEIREVTGQAGNFNVRLVEQPRYVVIDK
jgi:heterodisulfide reductase subunit A-like polyferredoxin